MADTIRVREVAENFGFEDFSANDEHGRILDYDALCIGAMPVDKNSIGIILTDNTHGAIWRQPPIP
jgi:hypothetical protein